MSSWPLSLTVLLIAVNQVGVVLLVWYFLVFKHFQ